jgi:hypothetical protein
MAVCWRRPVELATPVDWASGAVCGALNTCPTCRDIIWLLLNPLIPSTLYRVIAWGAA